jgi:hypothetical protein
LCIVLLIVTYYWISSGRLYRDHPVYTFFGYSSKRQSKFIQFQQFTDTELHKLLHPSATRWLSLENVVNRVLEQWSALTLYFHEKWLNEKLLAAEQIHQGLNDPFVKMYFLFLKWILAKFNKMNVYFQSDKMVLTDMDEVIRGTYRDLLVCFLDRAYVFSKELNEINPSDKTRYKQKRAIYRIYQNWRTKIIR